MHLHLTIGEGDDDDSDEEDEQLADPVVAPLHSENASNLKSSMPPVSSMSISG